MLNIKQLVLVCIVIGNKYLLHYNYLYMYLSVGEHLHQI